MSSDWSLWDYLTIAGALFLVLGYVLVKIKKAMDGDGGCGGCSGCACSLPAQKHCPSETSVSVHEIHRVVPLKTDGEK
jgi:hypothetical protein